MPENRKSGTTTKRFRAAKPWSFSRVTENASTAVAWANPQRTAAGHAASTQGERSASKATATSRKAATVNANRSVTKSRWPTNRSIGRSGVAVIAW